MGGSLFRAGFIQDAREVGVSRDRVGDQLIQFIMIHGALLSLYVSFAYIGTIYVNGKSRESTLHQYSLLVGYATSTPVGKTFLGEVNIVRVRLARLFIEGMDSKAHLIVAPFRREQHAINHIFARHAHLVNVAPHMPRCLLTFFADNLHFSKDTSSILFGTAKYINH